MRPPIELCLYYALPLLTHTVRTCILHIGHAQESQETQLHMALITGEEKKASPAGVSDAAMNRETCTPRMMFTMCHGATVFIFSLHNSVVVIRKATQHLQVNA